MSVINRRWEKEDTRAYGEWEGGIGSSERLQMRKIYKAEGLCMVRYVARLGHGPGRVRSQVEKAATK